MWHGYHEALQNQNIEEAKDAAGSAKRDAQNAMMRLRKAEAQIEKLLLITEALWQIAKSSNNLNDEDLTQMVGDIQEFHASQNAAGASTKCTACERPVPRSKNKCMYCGQEAARGLFER